MPYSQPITRQNPSCFLFIVDQSGSMSDCFYSSMRQKAQGVADAINRLLQELVNKCSKNEGVRDYYHIGVLGYGGDNSDNKVGPALGGNLSGRKMVPVSEIADNPLRIETRNKEDGAGGIIATKFPVWFDPTANGGTPMRTAMQQAKIILQDWLSQHTDCFPPIVIHLTDGEATDGDPQSAMRELTALQSSDGNVLLFNVHISDKPGTTMPISFPDAAVSLPDEYAQLLFDTASFLTPAMREIAREKGLNPSESAKAFVLNADLVLIIQALEIGTRPSNLR